MLNLRPISPPDPSPASLCRQFGQAVFLLIKDAIRLAVSLAILWLAARLLGFSP